MAVKQTLKEDARPYMPFFVADWLGDAGLRMCNLMARGLWIDMLCIMWHSEAKGVLLVNGQPPEVRELAKAVGSPVGQVRAALKELEDKKVFSRMLDGTIYSRRMYSKWQHKRALSEKRSQAGLQGAAKRWGKMANDGKTIANDGKCNGGEAWQTDAIISESDLKVNTLHIDTLINCNVEEALKNKVNRQVFNSWFLEGFVFSSIGGVPQLLNIDDAFEYWWIFAIAKVGKPAAKIKWKVRVRQVGFDVLLMAIKGYYIHKYNDAKRKGQDVDPAYCQYPETFLNKDRWRDYLGVKKDPPSW